MTTDLQTACARYGNDAIAGFLACQTLMGDDFTITGPDELREAIQSTPALLWTLIEDEGLSTEAAAEAASLPLEVVTAYRVRVGL